MKWKLASEKCVRNEAQAREATGLNLPFSLKYISEPEEVWLKAAMTAEERKRKSYCLHMMEENLIESSNGYLRSLSEMKLPRGWREMSLQWRELKAEEKPIRNILLSGLYYDSYYVRPVNRRKLWNIFWKARSSINPISIFFFLLYHINAMCHRETLLLTRTDYLWPEVLKWRLCHYSDSEGILRLFPEGYSQASENGWESLKLYRS